jgi:hypothetical protein
MGGIEDPKVMRGRSSHISSGRRRAMKRYLVFGAVLAALMIGGESITWALDLGTSGSYRLRGFYNDNLTDGDKNVQDSAAYYASQFMLTTKANQEGVSGVVTLLAGSTNLTGNRLLGGTTSFGPDGSFVDVLEIYIKADFKTWALTAGRSGLKFGNGVVLDAWVDGIWADLGLGGMTLTVGTAKLVESTDSETVGIGNVAGTPGTGDDADLYFVNAGLGKTGMASGTNVFLAYLMDRGAALGGPAGAGDETTVLMLGGATDLDMNGIRLKAELDFLTGTNKNNTAAGGDLDLQGYNLVLGAKLDAGGLPLGLDLVYTSGQDPTSTDEANINGLSGNYPLGIIVTNTGARSLGVTDGTCLGLGGGSTYSGGSPGCVGSDGLMALKVSSGITHGPHTIDVAAIWAQATEDPDDAGPADESFGIELDATITWALTKQLSLMGGVGYLLAGDYVQSFGGNTGVSDNLTVLVAQLGYTF